MQVIMITAVKTADLVKFWNENFTRVQGDFREIKKFADRQTAEKRTDLLVAKLSATFEEYNAIPEGWMPAPEGTEGQELDAVIAQYESQSLAEIKAQQEGATATQAETDTVTKPEGEATEPTTEEEKTDPEDATPPKGHNAFSLLVQSVQQAQAKAEQNGGDKPMSKSSDSKASNSDGVAASWADNEVRAARLKRDGVGVKLDGATVGIYKSTHDAFRALRLPDNKHIRFRLKLKEAHRDGIDGGTATFEHNGKKYVFSIIEAAAE